jgi:hypothetical protein
LEESQDKPPTGLKPVRLAASAALSALSETYFRDLANTRVEGRPIAWTTSMAPIELALAFDGTPFFPEDHAALCRSRIEDLRYEKGGHEQWISV